MWYPAQHIMQTMRREAMEAGDRRKLHIISIADGERRGGGELPYRRDCVRMVKQWAEPIIARWKAEKEASDAA
jgi:hypothetical protein